MNKAAGMCGRANYQQEGLSYHQVNPATLACIGKIQVCSMLVFLQQSTPTSFCSRRLYKVGAGTHLCLFLSKPSVYLFLNRKIALKQSPLGSVTTGIKEKFILKVHNTDSEALRAKAAEKLNRISALL